MGKLTGPLFSLDARGTLAKTLTYASWRGIKYARQRVIPSNPQSAAQTVNRDVWATLSAMYTRAPSLMTESWDAAAVGQPYTGRNRFFSINQALLQGASALTNGQWLALANGGIPPLTAVSSDAGGQILNLTLTQPTVPDGWTQTASIGAAVLAGDPSPAIIRTPIAEDDTSDPFTLVPIDVNVAGTYIWSVQNKYTKPDGSFAYSAPLTGSQVIA